MHRLDVRIGKQRQHAQRLRRLHFPRERAHRLLVEDISPQRGATSPDGCGSASAPSPSHTHPAPAAPATLSAIRALSRAWSPVLLPLPVSCSSAARYSSAQCCMSAAACQTAPPTRHRTRSPPFGRSLSPLVCGLAPAPQNAAYRSAPSCARPPCTGGTRRGSPARRCHGTPAPAAPETPAYASRAARCPQTAPAGSPADAATATGPSSRCADSRGSACDMRSSLPRSSTHPVPPSPQTVAAPPPDRAPDRPPPCAARIQRRSPARPARKPAASGAPPPRRRLGKGRLRRCGRSAIPARLSPRRQLQHLGQSALHAPRMAEVQPHPVRRIHALRHPVRRACRRSSPIPISFAAAASCACQSSVLSSRSCR